MLSVFFFSGCASGAHKVLVFQCSTNCVASCVFSDLLSRSQEKVKLTPQCWGFIQCGNIDISLSKTVCECGVSGLVLRRNVTIADDAVGFPGSERGGDCRICCSRCLSQSTCDQVNSLERLSSPIGYLIHVPLEGPSSGLSTSLGGADQLTFLCNSLN